jgi:hypothetical protein
MVVQGNILKMKTVFSEPVEYYLSVGNNELKMNDLIGRQILLEYLGEINCIRCGRKTGKSFFQGKITGIKGQYILFEDNRVLNIRKFGGYSIRLSY